MTRKTKLILLFCLPLIGVLAGYILMARQVTINVDGISTEITTHALTVRGALRSAGYDIGPLDKVTPRASSWLSRAAYIVLDRARVVRVWNDSTGKLTEVNTPSLIPLEILVGAGITPSADDGVRVNGNPVLLTEAFSFTGSITVQYTPAVRIAVVRDGENFTFRTAASNLGQALWAQDIRLHGGDALNQGFIDTIDPQKTLTIASAVPLVITADGRDIGTFASASTVGEALALVDVSLQDLDYSKPAESDPLPEDGRIKVVRVKEEVLIDEQSIPYQTESTTDSSLKLDQTRVVTVGEFGLQVVRVHVRYENGKEVSRVEDPAVILKEPVNQVVAYGTSVDVLTANTDCGKISYYRKLEVTATAYSPCNSDADKCYPLTASGVPVQRGVIAVSSAWYKLLKGSQICVPGYGIGTIEDVGSYPYNPNWIDLGYTDAEYATAPLKYAKSITIYFLMPIPPGGVPVLP